MVQNGSTKRTAHKDKAQRFNDVRFVRYELTNAEKERCKLWCTTFDELDDALSNIVSAGYRVSTKWDDYGNCYGCFVQTYDEKDANFGCILTGRGSTAAKAVKQALFKHFVIFDLLWGAWLETRENPEIDD